MDLFSQTSSGKFTLTVNRFVSASVLPALSWSCGSEAPAQIVQIVTIPLANFLHEEFFGFTNIKFETLGTRVH